MAPDNSGGGEITVARDYNEMAVVIDTGKHEKRLAPASARTLAQSIRVGAGLPLSPFGGGEELAEEIEKAADDVEAGQ